MDLSTPYLQTGALMTPLGIIVHLEVPIASALEGVRAALRAEGFGILTEIDMQAAFKEKLALDFQPYVILGACNPALAYRALSDDPAMGLLLPCNVTVEADGAECSIVRLVDPMSLMATEATGASSVVRDVALDAQQRLSRVARQLRAAHAT